MTDLTMFRAVPREGGEMSENTPTPEQVDLWTVQDWIDVVERNRERGYHNGQMEAVLLILAKDYAARRALTEA